MQYAVCSMQFAVRSSQYAVRSSQLSVRRFSVRSSQFAGSQFAGSQFSALSTSGVRSPAAMSLPYTQPCGLIQQLRFCDIKSHCDRRIQRTAYQAIPAGRNS